MALVVAASAPEVVLKTKVKKTEIDPFEERPVMCDGFWACVLNDYLEDDSETDQDARDDRHRPNAKGRKKGVEGSGKEKRKKRKKKKRSVKNQLELNSRVDDAVSLETELDQILTQHSDEGQRKPSSDPPAPINSIDLSNVDENGRDDSIVGEETTEDKLQVLVHAKQANGLRKIASNDEAKDNNESFPRYSPRETHAKKFHDLKRINRDEIGKENSELRPRHSHRKARSSPEDDSKAPDNIFRYTPLPHGLGETATNPIPIEEPIIRRPSFGSVPSDPSDDEGVDKYSRRLPVDPEEDKTQRSGRGPPKPEARFGEGRHIVIPSDLPRRPSRSRPSQPENRSRSHAKAQVERGFRETGGNEAMNWVPADSRLREQEYRRRRFDRKEALTRIRAIKARLQSVDP